MISCLSLLTSLRALLSSSTISFYQRVWTFPQNSWAITVRTKILALFLTRYKVQFLANDTKCDRVGNLLPFFKLGPGALYHNKKLHVPRQIAHRILRFSPENKVSGHFSFTENLLILEHFHWQNKTQHVQAYWFGYSTCQKRKHGRTKPIWFSQLLELPKHRWGPTSMYFITHLPGKSWKYDCITHTVNLCTRLVLLFQSPSTDTSAVVALCSSVTIFSFTDCLTPSSLIIESQKSYLGSESSLCSFETLWQLIPFYLSL